MERQQEFGDDDTPESASEQEGPAWKSGPSPFQREAPGIEDPEEAGAAIDLLPQFLKRTATAVEDPGAPEGVVLPQQPRTLAEAGLSKAFLTDLTLKIIHYSGTPSAVQLTRRLGLGPSVMQHLLATLSEERLVEVVSQSDLYTGNYHYRLSERGTQRVDQALDRSRYAGPVPVTAEQYSEVMHQQQENRQAPSRARIKEALSDLVLSREVGDAVARALHSGKAAMFYGPSGNGKTSILGRFAKHLDGFALVPYAIYAYGQVIRVFDQSIHEPLEDLDARQVTRDESKMDRRWVLVRRAAVTLGAEIGRESLELTYDPQSRFYQAPPHIKAQGGVLIVDDFGRQKLDAKELLTRWLIPLERGWDTLTLITGEKVTVPFATQLLFGTNLDIHKLADEALLRRILYKVEIPNPRPEDFAEILRQTCRQKHVLVPAGGLEHAVERLYGQPGMHPRASNARDLLDMVMECASFDGREPALDRETFERVFQMFAGQQGDERPAA